MNEYTRREEVRWTLIASATLVLCIAAAVALLVTAEGPLEPDPGARAAAEAAEARAAEAKACTAAGERLRTEIDVFKENAKAARLVSPEPEPDPSKGPRARLPPRAKPEKDPNAQLAWGTAQLAYKQAKTLAACKPLIEQAAGARPDAAPGWEAILAAAALVPPSEADKAGQIEASRKLLGWLGEAPIDRVVDAARAAEAATKAAADAEAARAETAMVRKPLRGGILSRELAIGVGVGLSLVGLLVSFLSVRAASVRRLAALVPLREVARTAMPGAQAAAILRLAAQHNGGEPGLVIGAAVGGLLAAATFRLDADFFVAGVMGGLLVGLGAQWAIRLSFGPSRWRERAIELGDIEKPAIPIVLVLGGVNAGMEGQFIDFFNALPPGEAAATVEKLASQAEDRILAAAEAGHGAARPATAVAPGAPAHAAVPAPGGPGYPGNGQPLR